MTLENEAQARLITIPISHYCERARWTLDHFEVPYREDRHLQMFHRRATTAVGGSTVPVLVTDARVIRDSDEILRYAAARAEVPSFCVDDELARRIAGEFGVESRRVAYAWILPLKSLLLKYNNQGSPAWQGAILRVFYGRVLAYVSKRLDLSADRVKKAQDVVDEVFDQVAQRLADGRPYLAGDAFSSADLSFAALAAPLVLPDNYGVALPRLDELPEAPRREVQRLRGHEAGQHALRMYAEHR